MKKLRILFMGTPDFAVATLQKLIENDCTVVGVLTAPDRPAGRGKKLRQSPVKIFAAENNLTVLQPENLKNVDFVASLKTLSIDVAIVVAFRMLPKVVWQLPKLGTFNLHASLLPDYRGAAPINWVLINGEEKTGNTTFFIDEKIDTGRIILQQPIDIEDDDTAGTLHDKLMHTGSELVVQTLQKIASNTVKAIPQQEPEILHTAYKLNKENTKINWSAKGTTIYNLVRGLDPYPGAWCLLENTTKIQSVKIKSVVFSTENHEKVPGSIEIREKSIFAFVSDGVLEIKALQLPGKKVLSAKALLNGYIFSIDAKFS